MSFLSFFRSAKRQSTRNKRGKRSRSTFLALEMLESRTVPCIISGYAFFDANNNGIFDLGEAPIANSTIQLRNTSGTVIGTAVTDSNGYYQFTTDSNISTAPVTLTRTASIPSTATDWSNVLSVPQFDPSLGTLLSVDIINAGIFASQIKVESLDSALSTITATDSGTLTLTGLGFSAVVTNSSTSKSFNASAFDGVIDFAGTSGHDFGLQSANGSNSASVTNASSLSAYIGTGSISFIETAHATSSASGNGNLITQINSNASAQLSVVYHYIPSNALRPGTYTIVQVSQPPNILEGLESSNGVPIPGSVGSDTITVTLDSNNNNHSTNNDFAELHPASVAGFVYYDQNNNGVRDAADPGIPNTQITLTGTNDLGPVNLTTVSAADGSYQFTNLRPGTYAIAETQPSNYLQGRNSVGSLGGGLSNDQFLAIVVPQGAAGVNYNFGEILGGSLAGFVYVDSNNNGVKDPGEPPIPNTTITLSGTDDRGNLVSQTQVTTANGSYSFQGLRPGTYSVAETQPAGFDQGKNSLGSAGGTAGFDKFTSINLAPAVAGINYNFGELVPTAVIQGGSSACMNFSWGHPDVAVLSKLQFLSTTTSATTDPVLKFEATYVDGLYRAILGRPADAQGLMNWVVQLHNGLPSAQIVQSIWNSPEHRGMEVDNFYANILHRTADAAGRTHWINAMMAGASEEDVEASLFASGEYQAAHPDNNSYVAGLYADVLGRSATSAEIAGFVQQLQSGATRAAIARLFLTSAEADSQSLQCDYHAFLNRVPDAAGVQSWLSAMAGGQMTQATVTEIILGSNEFLADAQKASMS
ncbi:MAG TPA: SdrD B-like domain-containing protein [Gemmataceae bacterium]|nr:SdrD B-like domain-containing protein [Gemmataceae bacterium]